MIRICLTSSGPCASAYITGQTFHVNGGLLMVD
jgi:hypothetical protein